MTRIEPDNAQPQPRIWHVIAIIIGTAFLSGTMTGYLDHVDNPPLNSATGGGLVMLAGVGALLFYLSRFGRFWQSWTRRKRLYYVSLLLAAFIGFIVTLLLRIGAGAGGFEPFGSGPFNPTAAIMLSVLWLVGMATSILIYQRNIDDHERHAYLWAGVIGFNVIVFAAPIWWLLARAALVPPVDGMLLLLFALLANSGAYVWLKFR